MKFLAIQKYHVVFMEMKKSRFMCLHVLPRCGIVVHMEFVPAVLDSHRHIGCQGVEK